MNLGWLLENELYGYFLEVIKNFISLKKIIKDEKPKKIVSIDSLCDMSKEISKKTEIEIIEYTKTEHGDLAFDKIMIPFNFGKSVHNIQVSRKNAIRKKAFRSKEVKDPNNYIMYMCSDGDLDYFKSKITNSNYNLDHISIADATEFNLNQTFFQF